MTSKNLPWHGLTAQLFLKFFLTTQHKVPFTNTSEATKRSSHRTENAKSSEVTHRRSRVGLSIPIYTNHDARFVLVSIFTVPHIYGLNYAWLPIEPISAHDQMRDRFSSSVWNFRWWIADVLHAKHHLLVAKPWGNWWRVVFNSRLPRFVGLF